MSEENPSLRKRLFNDNEFKDVVKTFYEIVRQINLSYKKQRRKKAIQNSHSNNNNHKNENTQKRKDESKLFKRNSFHIRIAYDLYTKSQPQPPYEHINFDDYDPTYQSKKVRRSNQMDTENNQNQVHLIEQAEQR